MSIHMAMMRQADIRTCSFFFTGKEIVVINSFIYDN